MNRHPERRRHRCGLLLVWAIVAAPLQADSLTDANAALAAGDYQLAIQSARDALSAGDSADAWATLGFALAKVGDTQGTEHALRQARTLGEKPRADVAVALARLRLPGDERPAALAELSATLDGFGDRDLDSRSLQALALAAELLAAYDATLFQRAVTLYQRAVERDPSNLAARVALGDLLLAKHNNRDALASYRGALNEDPSYAPAMLGIARSQHFDHLGAAMETATASVAQQPTLVPARVFLARLLLEQQRFEAAQEQLDAALAINPASLPALSMQAALYYLRGDPDKLAAQRHDVERDAPNFTAIDTLLAEMAARTRRYPDAVDFALSALTRDDRDWRAIAQLGTNRLRLGQMRQGRRALELAFAGDPFDVRTKNTLDLLDKLDDYRFERSDRFYLLAERGRAELLAPHLLPLAERAYDYYAERYQVEPPTPIRIEVYTHHEDFSVRTVGLTGLDILGASFGPVILLDSPRPGEQGAFNWASALWHEIAHTFHLAMSQHRAPRWFSEGLAVHEEHLARPGWGGDVSPGFLGAWQQDKLRPASELETAFLQPRFGAEVPYSYYLSSLLIAYIEETHGTAALVELLNAFAAGDTSMAAVGAHLGYTASQWDSALHDYVQGRFGHAAAALFATGDDPSYEALLGGAHSALAADDLETALTFALGAQAAFPEHAGPGSSYRVLAEIHERQDQPAEAIRQLAANVAIDADDLGAHLQLATLYVRNGDDTRARDLLERALLIQPFNATTHEQLAALYEAERDYALAVRERRAVVALDPADPVAAHYALAAALQHNGDPKQARDELLRTLEHAPLYEDALELLLQIHEALNSASDPQTDAGQPDA